MIRSTPMKRRPLMLAVSSVIAGLMAAACSSGGTGSDPSPSSGSSGVAGDAAGGETGGRSGAGGVAGTGGAGGAAGTSGAAGTAGSGAETRWLDPGEGVGCGTINGSACGGVPTWGCAGTAPTNPDCQPASTGRTYYCCGNATCIRDWPEDETFCPGPPIMINCVASAAPPARCSRYGTSDTTWCCEP
jgi:hypothetical protein